MKLGQIDNPPKVSQIIEALQSIITDYGDIPMLGLDLSNEGAYVEGVELTIVRGKMRKYSIAVVLDGFEVQDAHE